MQTGNSKSSDKRNLLPLLCDLFVPFVVPFILMMALIGGYVAYSHSARVIGSSALISAFEDSPAHADPEAYLDSLIKKNNGALPNPMIYFGNIDVSPTRQVDAADVWHEFRTCVVGVVGVTPIPVSYSSFSKDEADDIALSLLGSTDNLYPVLSQSKGAFYLQTIDANSNMVGDKAHPIAVSTECIASVLWRLQSLKDMEANMAREDADRRLAEAQARTAQNRKGISAGENAFVNSTHIAR